MIKKCLMAMFFILAIVLAGCSNGSDYKVNISKPLYFQKDTAVPFEIKVTEKNKPVKGLTISAELSMANMDHGTSQVKLAEGQNGAYSGKVKLPMEGKYEINVTIQKDGKKSENTIDYTVKKAAGVAIINGKWIKNEDLKFYELISKLQLTIDREAAQKKYSGPQLEEELSYLDSQEKTAKDKNRLLTQIIRIRAMALLAEEKEHKATAETIQNAINKDHDQYNQYDSTKKLIQAFGESKFHELEKKEYPYIILSNQILADLVAQAKKENPTVGIQEVNYLAQQSFEDLLVSQMNSLKVEIL
ncbi:FixH family protein [Neobacillus ginsengisoli]|uniref:YtkA-like domain-containing protein n=1 Tax=Neobacillus ginsengisoli TaxID=904295 RepID=A0ABT9Y1A8_9BACI|nr:FixH family protein [Neobacillus ginsengisoli]MDQ0200937.1 hypothetical protein [Neobacillus ginsengisoli]